MTHNQFYRLKSRLRNVVDDDAPLYACENNFRDFANYSRLFSVVSTTLDDPALMCLTPNLYNPLSTSCAFLAGRGERKGVYFPYMEAFACCLSVSASRKSISQHPVFSRWMSFNLFNNCGRFLSSLIIFPKAQSFSMNAFKISQVEESLN